MACPGMKKRTPSPVKGETPVTSMQTSWPFFQLKTRTSMQTPVTSIAKTPVIYLGFSFCFIQSHNRDSQGWLPLTVKQLSDFINGGVEINNVKLVGMVSNRKEKINEVTFTLDDKTGRMDCHRWVNDYVDSKEMAEIKNGTFAEIQGHLKDFQGKKHLEAFSVRPVTDIDQVAYRFMECMHVDYHNTKFQGQGSNSAQPQITNAAITNGSSSYHTAPFNQFSSQPSFAEIKQKVLDLLSVPTYQVREDGVHRDELSQHLKVPLVKIKESLATLEEEGAVYPTIDYYHYKSFEVPVSENDWQTTLDGISRKILDFLSIPEHKAREKGIHLNALAQNLKVPLQKIMEAILHLEEDGLVYSTIDEFHYKSSWTPEGGVP